MNSDQPPQYPHGLREALSKLVTTSATIDTIYLGHHQVGDGVPTLFALVQCAGGVSENQQREIMGEVFGVAQEHLGDQEMDLGFYDESYAELCRSDAVTILRRLDPNGRSLSR